MPVHIYGHPVDMDPLLRIAEENGLVVIEDAAEAHGAEYLSARSGQPTWRRCGGFGHLSTFSFYANKIVTSGEGGMVLTNDAAHAEKLRRLRNLGFIPERRFWHEHAGHNFRLTNLQAAVGLAQVERVDDAIEKKRWLGRRYTEVLADIPWLQLPVEESWARNVYWMYGVVIDPKTGMDAVVCARRLRDAGIDTRPFFLGMHEQPALLRLGLFQGETYPVAEHIARQGLYLPSGLTVDESQVQAVAQALREVLS
jgi:perosamine synthetase